MSDKPSVAIAACSTYTADDLDRAVSAVCYESGFPKVQGKHVLVKPNILSDQPPDKAVTTHPEVLRAVIGFLQQLGATVYVGDSPALQRSSFTGELSGLRTVSDEMGACWLDFTSASVKLPSRGSQRSRAFTVTAHVEQMDLIISLPKMKTHQLMYMTGAVKNMFGLIPSLAKSPYHLRCPGREQFASMLLDLYETVTPEYSIMDAVTAMEGPGPNSGYSRHVGYLLGSRDALALDYTAALMMQYDPELLPQFSVARKRSLLTFASSEEIRYPLLPVSDCLIPGFITIPPEMRRGLLKTAMGFLANRRRIQKKEPKPLFNPDICTLCDACVEICPVSALHNSTSQIIVDYRSCIRCYCCHEICPVDAITIEQREAR